MDIEGLLTQANSMASPEQIAQAERANQDNRGMSPAEPVKVVQEEVNKEQVQKLTPEQERANALAILAKYENADINPETGEVILKDSQKVEKKEEQEEEDFSKLPLEEQIKALQDKLAKEKGEEPEKVDPLKTVEKKVEDAGLNLSDYEKQYLEDGVLSEESLKSLKDAGFDETAIEAYINTRTSQEESKAMAVIEDVCENKQNFDSMVEWMQENLDESEIDEYNKGVTSEHAKVYLKDMYGRFSQDTSTRTIRNRGGRVTTSEAQETFKSQYDMASAMSDPRYEYDPAYRAQVRAKAMKFNQ